MVAEKKKEPLIAKREMKGGERLPPAPKNEKERVFKFFVERGGTVERWGAPKKPHSLEGKKKKGYRRHSLFEGPLKGRPCD